MMKTTFTLFLFGLFTGSAIAQPSFTTLPTVTNKQESVTRATAYSGTNPSGTAGANKTWDFSTLDFSSSSDETANYFTDPSTAPHAADFPEATFYSMSEEGHESFYQLTADSYINLGYVSGTHIVHYDDPQTIYTIPFLYSETQYDTDGYTEESNGVEYVSSATNSTVFDGYGTLVLPYGTLTDVARLKINSANTYVIKMGGVEMVTYYSNVIYYIWILPGEIDPVFGIMYFETSEDDGPATTTVTAHLTLPQSTTSVIKNTVASNAFIYPQPATQEATVMAKDLRGNCLVKVYNLSGDVVSTTEQVADSEKLIVDVQRLSTGMYMLEVKNEDRTYRQKLVVQ